MKRRPLAIILLAVSITFFWKRGLRGRNTMEACNVDEERRLVEQCRSGSDDAWNQLHKQYIGLVRRVVRDQKWSPSEQDIEDVTQNVLMDLIPALGKFDCSYRLSQFICGVAKRTTREEILRRKALKRSAEVKPLNVHDGSSETVTVVDDGNSQEDQLESEELKELLRVGLRKLEKKCREILHYRDFEELPYNEIEELLGQKANTLTKTRERCLEQLKAVCLALLREGCTR